MKRIYLLLPVLLFTGCASLNFENIALYQCTDKETSCDKNMTWYPVATSLSGNECSKALTQIKKLEPSKTFVCRTYNPKNSSSFTLPWM